MIWERVELQPASQTGLSMCCLLASKNNLHCKTK